MFPVPLQRLCHKAASAGPASHWYPRRLVLRKSFQAEARQGVPACRGVLNIVHGTHDTVNRILDHKDIKAISFVGSDAAGRYIYKRGSASGKRVQVRASPGIADCGSLPVLYS